MPGKNQVYFTVTPAEDLIIESVQQSNKHEDNFEDDDVERYKNVLLFRMFQINGNLNRQYSKKVNTLT